MYAKHRYNIYLQGIELISFTRDAKERFISSYIDKHIYKSDQIYLALEGYKKYREEYEVDNIANLCDYLCRKNGYISDHYKKISEYNNQTYYFKLLRRETYPIEVMNEKIWEFLKTYHKDQNMENYREYILGHFTNSINSGKEPADNKISIETLDEEGWRTLLKKKINYKELFEYNASISTIIERFME
jgi:predicted house-cleaning noncanonical NTP pyrophosphatase (MazG superfamily)